MRYQFRADQSGERVDSFLTRHTPEYSRSYWQKRCQGLHVLVYTTPVKASYILKEGDEITAITADPQSYIGQDIPIVYEDDDVIVLNKPRGVLTHAKGNILEEFTVADFVRPRTTDGLVTNRPGIVHRLDRETSGLLIAAKNPEAKRWLQKQFSQRKVKKTYIALVKGHPKEPAALLKLPIERNPKRPQTFRVGGNGKPAQTQYETLKTFAAYSLLQLMPQTGRTHQLRVHMHYLGRPIVGDTIYGTKEDGLGRMFLHAAQLELTLPSRERKVFTAPLPEELQNFLKSLE